MWAFLVKMYVKMKELGPMGWGVRRARPPPKNPQMQKVVATTADSVNHAGRPILNLRSNAETYTATETNISTLL